jgi:epoxyqueuosine reductase
LGHNLRVTPTELTAWVIERALAQGFDLCGVVRMEDFENSEDLARLPEWLARGYAGEMKYLHDSRRQSPAQVLAGAKSIIVCALNYNTSPPYSANTAREPGRGWISRYAWGKDYHEVVGGKLDALVADLQSAVGESFEARAYVDTGPIHERVAAKLAGLGWLAKNTCLINPEFGSWLFLGVILATLDLAPSLPPSEQLPPDLCGNCALCIEACPTGAIVEPYVLDARRCISYLSIELRGSIPEELRELMDRHVFGCDICQDVCPYNRRAPANPDPGLQPGKAPSSGSLGPAPRAVLPPAQSLLSPYLEWLASLEEAEFRELFHTSAIKRTKWRGLVRNACIALGNSGLVPSDPAHPRVAALLGRLAESQDAIIAEHARWALARLRAAG